MKTKVKVILSLIILAILFSTAVVFAVENDIMLISEDEVEGSSIPVEWRRDVVVSDKDVIDSQLFEATKIYTLESSIVEGDAYIAGETVKLNNVDVNGNLFIFAEEARLENVNVSGSAYVFALDGTFKEFNVQRTFYVMSEDLKIDNKVATINDLFLYGEDTEITALINRDATIAGDEIDVLAGTVISRNFVYPGDTDVTIDDSVKVLGTKDTYLTSDDVNVDIEDAPTVSIQPDSVKTKIENIVSNTIVMGIIGLIIVLVAYEKLLKLAKTGNLGKNLLVAAGKGILVFSASIFGIILLFITILGIPLAILAILVFIVLIVASMPFAAAYFAAAFVKEDTATKGKVVVFTVLFVLAVSALEEITFGLICALSSFVVSLIGMGVAFDLIFKNSNKKSKDTKVEVKEFEVMVDEPKKEPVNVTLKDVEVIDNVTEENKDILSKIDDLDDVDEIEDRR